MLWGSRVFSGRVPRLAPRLLHNSACVVCENLWLDEGNLRPVPPLKMVDGVPAFSAAVKTIYRFDANRWFAWNWDVDAVLAPVFGDSTKRTIWTQEADARGAARAPRMTSTTILSGGDSFPGVPTSRRLGIPAPAAAPTVVLGDKPDVEPDPGTPGARASGSIGNAMFQARDVGTAANGVRITIVSGSSRSVAWDLGTRTYTITITAGDTVGDINGTLREGTVVDNVSSDFSAAATTGTVVLTGGQDAEPAQQPEQLTAESHTWIYTFVSDLGEEGPPSPPSRVLDRAFGSDGSIQPVTISELATAPPVGWQETRLIIKRIYRSATGVSGRTEFQLLGEVPIARDTFEDTFLTANLGAQIISETWEPPKEDLTGLTLLPNGVVAAFRGREVHFCEPFQPHAWPPEYIQVVSADIVGLDNFGGTLVVGTVADPTVIAGSHPSQMAAAKMEYAQPCVSKHSFSYVDLQGVVYASPDGAVLVGPSGGQLISKDFFERRHWQAIDTENIPSVYHDGVYLMFIIPPVGQKGNVVAFDPGGKGVINFDDSVNAVYIDRIDDEIYVVDRTDNRLKVWATDGEGPFRTMRWRSKRYVEMSRTYSAAQVVADDYPVTLRIFGDAMKRFDKEVMDSQPFRLPAMGRRAEWAYEVEATHQVREVRIGAMKDML